MDARSYIGDERAMLQIAECEQTAWGPALRKACEKRMKELLEQAGTLNVVTDGDFSKDCRAQIAEANGVRFVLALMKSCQKTIGRTPT
jgi:hypothetical protein